MITGVAASGLTGSTVTGSVLFTNAGPQDAFGVGYQFTIGASGNTPTNVQFSSVIFSFAPERKKAPLWRLLFQI